MMKRKTLWCGWLVSASFIFGLALQNAMAQQKTEFKTENGVVVVSNPQKPNSKPGGPSKLLLKEDLVIGHETTATGDLFAQLRSVGVDDRENIWTLDWQDIKVRVFDKSGKLISTFGRKGQGPEEWQAPNRMVILPDGTGVILDVNKLTFYSLEGKCLKETSTGKTTMFRFRIDSRGTIYGDRMEFGEKRMFKLVKYDQSLNPVATLAEVEDPLKPGAINVFPRLFYCHVTTDDRLIWMLNSTYAFNVLNRDGKLIRKITKDFSPVKLTAEDKKRMLEEEYSDFPAKNQLFFPEYYPPIRYFAGDAEGGLYAQTYEKDDRGELLFDVFDTDGRCITQFSLPKEEMVFAVKKGKLYVLIQEDAEGRPLVKRYAMEWK
jgi:hypothetical protein